MAETLRDSARADAAIVRAWLAHCGITADLELLPGLDVHYVVKATEVDSQGRLNLSRQAAIEELTEKGQPIEEKIDKEAMAVALASPPPPPREPVRPGTDSQPSGWVWSSWRRVLGRNG